MYILLVLIVCCVIVETLAGIMLPEDMTSIQEKYWFTVVGYDYLVFRVRACSVARLVLAATVGNRNVSATEVGSNLGIFISFRKAGMSH